MVSSAVFRGEQVRLADKNARVEAVAAMQGLDPIAQSQPAEDDARGIVEFERLAEFVRLPLGIVAAVKIQRATVVCANAAG